MEMVLVGVVAVALFVIALALDDSLNKRKARKHRRKQALTRVREK